jgi:hypothetical protein
MVCDAGKSLPMFLVFIVPLALEFYFSICKMKSLGQMMPEDFSGLVI